MNFFLAKFPAWLYITFQGMRHTNHLTEKELKMRLTAIQEKQLKNVAQGLCTVRDLPAIHTRIYTNCTRQVINSLANAGLVRRVYGQNLCAILSITRRGNDYLAARKIF